MSETVGHSLPLMRRQTAPSVACSMLALNASANARQASGVTLLVANRCW